MSVVGLDHLQVAAPPGQEEAASGFYGGLLGLAELPGRRRLYTADPWGNRIELVEAVT